MTSREPQSLFGPVPIEHLRRRFKEKKKYLFGIAGSLGESNDKAAWFGVAPAQREAVWSCFVESMRESLSSDQGTLPHLVRARDLQRDENERLQGGRIKYNWIESIANWRQHDFCIVDLGCDELPLLKQFGRHCDGVALAVVGNVDSAAKQLRKLRHDAIPWIGYWSVTKQAA